MIYFITLITVILNCAFRRWFGSDSIWWKVSRGVKCALFLVFNAFCVWYITRDIINSGLFAGFGYLFFCLAIGMCFDIGRDGLPDEELKERYNKYIWHYLPDCLLKNHKYGFLYDFIYMGERFIIPSLFIALLPIVNYHFIIIGALISPVYAFCWTLHEKEKWFLEKIPYTNGKPTATAEYISGALFGLYPLMVTATGMIL